MSLPNMSEETRNTAEPLLPIEKKLIGWSIGIGFALLVVLLLLNYVSPLPL